MIYLKVIENSVKAFASLDTMKLVIGTDLPDLVISEDEWKSVNAVARVENGRIVLGHDKDVLFIFLRAERDMRLQATDYLLLPDYPISEENRAKVVDYRQKLRNLPSKFGAPWDGGGPNTPWPVFPEI